MSFLSALGKIGKAAVGFIPGVGPLASGALDAIGGVASGAAHGSAQQRVQEAPSQIGAYNANLNATALGDKRTALASLLGGGLQDAQIGRPAGSTIPTFNITGGLRPSAMNQQMLFDRLSQPIDPLKLPTAGLGEKILGGVGLGASILGALGQISKKKASDYGNDMPEQGGITGNLPVSDPNVFRRVTF